MRIKFCIYKLPTRTSTFQDQEKLLERVNLIYLKTLKTKKLNTKNPQVNHVQNMRWYADLISRPDVQFTDQKKMLKKVTKNWNWPVLIFQLLKISNINTDHKSNMIWSKRHNLQTKNVQFADQKKVWIGTSSTNWTLAK